MIGSDQISEFPLHHECLPWQHNPGKRFQILLRVEYADELCIFIVCIHLQHVGSTLHPAQFLAKHFMAQLVSLSLLSCLVNVFGKITLLID